jgi:hypothetical protein
MRHAVQQDAAFTFEHVIKLRAAFMIVQLRAVNVHCVSPSRYTCTRILAADEPVPPATSAALLRRFSLMPDEQGSGRGSDVLV